MVGYWQSMEAAQILCEVNEESHKGGLPDLQLMGGWKSGDVSRLQHTFERPFAISPITLRHLWVDLRNGAGP